MTIVDLKNLGYTDEPFVLANDVTQVIYVKDMSTKPRKRKDKEANTSYDMPKRHIVLSGKRDILGVDGKTDNGSMFVCYKVAGECLHCLSGCLGQP